MQPKILTKSAPVFIFMLLSTLVAMAQAPPSIQPEPSPEPQLAEDDETDLVKSIKRGDLSEMSRRLFAGAGANETNNEGGLPLCWAVRVNRRDMVELLLAKGANVNQEEDDGIAALNVAAAFGHAEMAKLLLSNGAAADHGDHGGHTPLIATAIGAMIRDVPPFMMNALWGEGTEKEQKLMAGVGNDHQKVMELLLAAGADANIQAEDCGLTALMIAAMGGNVNLVQMLLKHGATVCLKSGDWDALKYAEALDSQEGLADLMESEGPECAAALLSWGQLTAAGRQQVAQLLRAERCRGTAKEPQPPTPNDSSAPLW